MKIFKTAVFVFLFLLAISFVPTATATPIPPCDPPLVWACSVNGSYCNSSLPGGNDYSCVQGAGGMGYPPCDYYGNSIIFQWLVSGYTIEQGEDAAGCLWNPNLGPLSLTNAAKPSRQPGAGPVNILPWRSPLVIPLHG